MKKIKKIGNEAFRCNTDLTFTLTPSQLQMNCTETTRGALVVLQFGSVSLS